VASRQDRSLSNCSLSPVLLRCVCVCARASAHTHTHTHTCLSVPPSLPPSLSLSLHASLRPFPSHPPPLTILPNLAGTIDVDHCYCVPRILCGWSACWRRVRTHPHPHRPVLGGGACLHIASLHTHTHTHTQHSSTHIVCRDLENIVCVCVCVCVWLCVWLCVCVCVCVCGCVCVCVCVCVWRYRDHCV
jgi:hypothetical protein